jgi:hypothetical protein
MNYKDLERKLWFYLEVVQYENPIDSESFWESFCEKVLNAVYERSITEEELNELNTIYDTGVEWEE